MEQQKPLVIKYRYKTKDNVKVYDCTDFYQSPLEWELLDSTILNRLKKQLRDAGVKIVKAYKSKRSPHIKITTDKDVRSYILYSTYYKKPKKIK